MSTGKLIFLPPRFMTINTAIEQILEVENIRNEGIATKGSLAVGMARLGQSTQMVSQILIFLLAYFKLIHII